MKTIELLDSERAALSELKRKLEERFELIDFRIFGSKARGEAAPDSDIDVMIEIRITIRYRSPRSMTLCSRSISNMTALFPS